LIPRGHAIECRVYAEDPEKDFLPGPGRIRFWKEPSGPGIRVDTGVEAGSSVPLEYDPILAKLVVWGPDRGSATRRMIRALKEFVVFGVPTTIPYLADVIGHDAFAEGKTSTHFLTDHFEGWEQTPGPRFLQAMAAAAMVVEAGKRAAVPKVRPRSFDPWLDLGKWEMGRN
jgi:acetyl/propionyl-CoA carboxylase alpha subunit